jgi:hypothetical protein
MFFLFKRGLHFGRQPPPIVHLSGGLLLNGILCVLFGLAIFAAPDLLAFIVAIFLIIIGVSLLTAWWKVKQSAKNWK